MTRYGVAVAALTLAVTVTACGAEGGTAMPTPSAGSPSSSSSDEPAVPTPSSSPLFPLNPSPPTVVPSKPSDYIADGRIGGRVVKGGAGPCYTVVHDDGRRFALHNDAGLVLEEGTYIVAKVAPLRAKIDCGEGIPYELISFRRL